MDNRPEPALRILQLLLRCGMICREELDMVLEMMSSPYGAAALSPRQEEADRGLRVSGSRQGDLHFD
jgi:hypothetical protein